LLLLAPIFAQVVSGYEGSMMNGLQDVGVWQSYFNHPLGQRLGTMNNGVTIGTLVITPFTSYITDFLGRKRTLILGCFVILIGAATWRGTELWHVYR
jgi:MFS family permease